MAFKRKPQKTAKPGHSKSRSKARSTNAVSAKQAQSAVHGGRYVDRDESWLLFNRRVLEEADDSSNPLLERVKFLAITSTNLDEFIEIRVAGVLQRLEENRGLPLLTDEGGLTQEQRLNRLRILLQQFADGQSEAWNNRLVPELGRAGIRIVQWKNLRAVDRAYASKYFQEQIDPLLTPVTIDPSHPFPRVLNKALCIALILKYKRKSRSGGNPKILGVVTIPRSLPGLIALPARAGRHEFILLHDMIAAHLEQMFRGYNILSHATFRVTRNSNLYMQEEESRSVLESVAEELHNRRKGDVVRLEIDAEAGNDLVERLRSNFALDSWQVFRTTAPVNLSRMMGLYNGCDMPKLKFPDFHGTRIKFASSTSPTNIFELLRKDDILLHHPFDSYSTVEDFICAAATDPDVISIKQTLYRTSDDSTIFGALQDAAKDTDVTVVIELMARFDEASNIRWARELEDAGVQVFHGIFGFKTHCKLALVVRKDSDGVIRSYAHLGTGNYNPITARFYTDISLLTNRPELTDAILRVFRYLTAGWETGKETYRPLLVAPVTLDKDLLELINRETQHAKGGRPAQIIAKMNALLDGPTIDALYAASQAGVEIDLIIRGMCSLRAGVKGLSDNIRVRSIVGRFLEHSRIFWFLNGGKDEIFAGSADWMPRNLHERCEVVFPVVDKTAKHRLRNEVLESYLRDSIKARILLPNNQYVRLHPAGNEYPLSAQDWLMQRALHPKTALETAHIIKEDNVGPAALEKR